MSSPILLAISGSLRRGSYNNAILAALTASPGAVGGARAHEAS